MNGEFSLKTAYTLAVNNSVNTPTSQNSNFSWIWRASCLPRQKFFLWLIANNSLPSKHMLCSRGMNVNPMCSFCGIHQATVFHLFRECDIAKRVWNMCSTPAGFDGNHNFVPWLISSVMCQENSFFNIPFGTVFVFTLWSLWLARNKKVFNTEAPSPLLIITNAKKHADEFFAVTAAHSPDHISTTLIMVKWTPPPVSWIKFNIDGAHNNNNHHISAGGIARDHLGNCVFGFYQFIGTGNSFLAEVWAAVIALTLACDLNLKLVWLKSDSLNLVELLSN